jgi:iron complex outermembrane receptor protein
VDIPRITVRKMPETVSSVPATVQLIDRETIKKANIHSPSDVSLLVPGFSFNDPFGRFNPAPSFRGLIQPGLGDDPSIGFFNDGLYLSGRSSINSLAFDLEKIEVAKGPQNALYGRNSFGGAINAVSAKPSRKQEVWFDGRAGTKDRQQVEAGVNVPLSDQLRSRLALYWRDQGGSFDNSVEGGPEIGREETKAARLSFAFDPTPERDLLLQVTHISDEDSQPKGFLVPANCGPRTSDGQLRLFCGELPARAGPLAANDVGTEQEMGYIRDHSRINFEWEERLSPLTSLTTQIGGAMEDSAFIRDDDYQAQNAARAGIDTVRFDGQFDARLNHHTEDEKWKGLIGLSGYRFLNKVDRIDQLYVLGQTSPGGPQVKNTTDTTGVYGSLTRNLDRGFAITGDARWQWEGKTLNSTTNAISTGQPISLENSWTAFTPKLTGSWTAESGFLAYASVAKGYKSGGFNDRANIFDEERTYDPEENITYEVGTKNIKIADGLEGDLGLFWIDWTNQQVTAYSTAAATQNFFLNNAGETIVKGIEASLRWKPLENLSFDAGYTYADARFDSYRDPDLRNVSGFTPDGDVSGNRLPRYSPHQLSLNGQYRLPSFLPRWDFIAGGQFKFESSQYTDNSNTSRTGARTLLNLQAGLEKEGLGFGLFVDNALNEKDPAVGIPWTDATQGFRREWLVVPQDGVTAGVRVKVVW